MAIAIVGLFFLQTRRIGKQDLQQGGSAARAINRAAKTVTDESRKIAGMIDVRVGDDYGVNGGCVERRLLPVALAQFTQTLKQATVD